MSSAVQRLASIKKPRQRRGAFDPRRKFDLPGEGSNPLGISAFYSLFANMSIWITLVGRSAVSHLPFLAVVLGISTLGIWPLFHPGLYTAHDIWHQVARLFHYTHALQDGQVLPMWIGTLAQGYGYPLFIFSYHFPWWIASVLIWGGLPLFTALKCLYGGFFLLAGVTMYVLGWQVSKDRWLSAVTALLYVWAPYHFQSVFVSAAIGTVVLYALLPMMGSAGYMISQRKWWSGGWLLGVTLSAAILTHVMTLVMCGPFLLLAAVGYVWQQRRERLVLWSVIRGAVLAMVVALVLSAFYLGPLITYLPAIKSQQDGSGLRGLYVSNFPTLKQLIYSPWGFGPITERASDGEISFQVGIVQWIGVGLLALWVVWQYFRKVKSSAPAMQLLALYGLTLFFMLQLSKPFWKFGDSLVSLDYPFRLLLMAVFLGTLAALWLLKESPRWLSWPLSVLLVVIALYTNRNHSRVNQYTDFPLDLYVRAEVTTNTFHEYLPLQASSEMLQFERPPAVQAARLGATQLEQHNLTTQPKLLATGKVLAQNTRELQIAVTASASGWVSLQHYVFPDMQVLLNGKPTSYIADQRGLIALHLEEGNQALLVRYQRPFWMSILTGVSLLGWLSAIGVLITSAVYKGTHV
jgi:hypothetical protein